MLNDETRRPDIVHLHTAADWSWWRKRRFAKMAHKAGVPSIVHIHSGQFDTWLSSSKSRIMRFKQSIRSFNCRVVVLSVTWQNILSQLVGETAVINNPLDPLFQSLPNVKRETGKILFLGRNDPVKGGDFAQKLIYELQETNPTISLSMTGVEVSKYPCVKALGWVTEEQKRHHLSTASALIVPSRFEGQPMVVLEALTLGTPVLLSDRIHSLPEQLPRAQFEDIDDWKTKLLKLLFSSKSIFDKDLLLKFSITSVQEQWKTLYENKLK